MNGEPQPSTYRPDTQIARIADWIADPVRAADFPDTKLRFRNDRWDGAVGLDSVSDEDWLRHFGRFEPLPDNLRKPLALRYHGHQFRNYNPDIGDGRGFLFAQLRDGADRLLDLGTKGSGQTPYSRFGDGRLTLKGAVREVLATEMLEALGVHTSKTFSVIETGEALDRNDEPSPTRSAVMVRLSHGHIRIGSFQRLAALGEEDHLAALVDYALRNYPGPPPPDNAPGRDLPPAQLLHLVVERLADLAASYVAAGFVHGVLNTDNMNVSGESFDYGPWRWLPRWDAGFTAAYFDHSGLYAFGRQAEAIHWNCAQLAIALRPICEAPPLVAALERFQELFTHHLARRFAWRLGVADAGAEQATELVTTGESAMVATGMQPDAFFHAARTGRLAKGEDTAAFRAALGESHPQGDGHPYWHDEEPQSMLIEEVEAIWSHIDHDDDWGPLYDKVAALRRMGDAHGPAPVQAGQAKVSIATGVA
ncbi:YdiU family protein [Croceicoccus ponticola]|uniref:Protein nucleotidyltransferase YdiU n=1 Tax=Croceicoccus ponticola TaxID=2217664 RepID=A0A437H1N8_9SPHN|nr:YdiU family protein [Croceicoccus ponticola]RVQ69548.1 YdiU family protein [Croceicoccus ponticola]